ncbi:MAG: phosphopantetheine-binding protein [Acetobacteraceae bacterium]
MSNLLLIVIDQLTKHFKNEANLITADTRLVEDLQADSFDFVEVVFELETRLGIVIPDDFYTSKLKTVDDIVIALEEVIAQKQAVLNDSTAVERAAT